MIADQIGRVFRPGVRWAWAAGVLIPVSVGIFLVALIGLSFTREPWEPDELLTANSIEAYEVGQPVYFEEERLWVLKTPEQEMIALYDVDPLSSCTTPWWSEQEYMGKKGWFQDACRGSHYDLEGRCFGGPCEVGLSRLPVTLNGLTVVVNLTEQEPGPPRDDSLTPVNPPAGEE
jgi:hypothetical protein